MPKTFFKKPKSKAKNALTNPYQPKIRQNLAHTGTIAKIKENNPKNRWKAQIGAIKRALEYIL